MNLLSVTPSPLAPLGFEEARRIAARMEPRLRSWRRENPGQLAALDQAEAAGMELLCDAVLGPDMETWTTHGADATALTLVVVAAMLRRVTARCPHVTWPAHPDARIVVDLTTRTAHCGAPACLTAVLRCEQDERCDLCEREAEQFRPCATPLGPLFFVHMNVCPACAGELADEEHALTA